MVRSQMRRPASKRMASPVDGACANALHAARSNMAEAAEPEVSFCPEYMALPVQFSESRVGSFGHFLFRRCCSRFCHRAFEVAAEPGLVAGQSRASDWVCRRGREGAGEAGALVESVEFLGELRGLFVHFEIEEAGFDGPRTAQAPACGGDFLDELCFVVGGRGEGCHANGEQALPAFLSFVRENEEMFGAESVCGWRSATTPVFLRRFSGLWILRR